MAQYDSLTIALQQTSVVIRFITNYDKIIRSMRTKLKSRVISPCNSTSLQLIAEGLGLLEEVVDTNNTNAIPHYMIYNLLFLARAVINHYDRRTFYKPVDDSIELIKTRYQYLEEKPTIETKLVRQK